MEAPPDVPVGNLIDFSTEEPSRAPSGPSPPAVPSDNGHLGEVTAEESDATESADSENDMGESPARWGHRRSSSGESFSSNHSSWSARDEAASERRDFVRHYVEKIFTGG